MNNNQLVMVLGMHRSGTSTLTRGLKSLGVDLGDSLMSAAEGINDKGFWEDTEVVYLNEQILYVVGSSWHSLKPIDEAALLKLREAGYLHQAAEILRRKVLSAPVFGLKDPRISKLLPFWKEVIDFCEIEARYILAIRNPMSVMKSLVRRDGFDVSKCYYIWLEHVLVALGDCSVRNETIVVDYDRLLDDPKREMDRIAGRFGLSVNSDELTEYQSQFLETELRHSFHAISDMEADPFCPAIVRELYLFLLDLSSDKLIISEKSTVEQLEEFQRSLRTLTPLLSFTDVVLGRSDTLQEALRKSLKTADDTATVITSLQQTIAERDTAIAERDTAIVSLREQGSLITTGYAENERYLNIAMTELAMLKHSTSWRLTAPLRYVTRRLRTARVIFKIAPTVIRRQGGIRAAIRSAMDVAQAEGWDGLKGKIRWTAVNISALQANVALRGKIQKSHSIEPHYINSLYTIENSDLDLTPSLAVHLWLANKDGLEKILPYLNNIRYDFELYVSIAPIDSALDIRNKLKQRAGRASKVVVANADSNVSGLASLIKNFGELLLKYEFLAHLEVDVASRDAGIAIANVDALETLMGPVASDGREVIQIIRLMNDGAPAIYSAIGGLTIESALSEDKLRALAHTLLRRHVHDDNLDQPLAASLKSGMFWARTGAIADFLACPVDSDEFASLLATDSVQATDVLKQTLLLSSAKSGETPIWLCNGDSLSEQRYYEEQTDFSARITDRDTKILSYYLPQFHPTPENDEWHGVGFTEWTKVRAANPLFEGHYQQHIPHPELGYYLLDSPEVFVKQADMMKKAGIFGQIFYHYWFGGKLILEKPAQMLRDNPHIDLPFCFCWANENWTRRWDGNEQEILLGQNYSAEDAVGFIQYLIPFFKDKRYIRINNRPVLLVYRASSISDSQIYLDAWAAECIKEGLLPPYVVAVLTRGASDPRDFGMDAGTERVLHDWTDGGAPEIRDRLKIYREFHGKALDYNDVVNFYTSQNDAKPFTYWRSMVATWDNTARYGSGAYVVHNTTPEAFQGWLENLIQHTKTTLPSDNQFILINAWNEWAEGAHLEPDTRHGYAFLNSVGRALSGTPFSKIDSAPVRDLQDLRLRLDFSDEALGALESSSRLKTNFINCLGRSKIFSRANVEIVNPVVREELAVHFPDIPLYTFDEGQYSHLLMVNHICYFLPSAIESLALTALAYPKSVTVANGYGRGDEVAPAAANASVDKALAAQASLVIIPKRVLGEVKSYKLCPAAWCSAALPDVTAQPNSLPEITTIVRVHPKADFNLLRNALLSLFAMRDCIVQPLIATQDLSSQQHIELKDLLSEIPWDAAHVPVVNHHVSGDGHADLRSQMLNASLKAVRTRYAAFLDYDDLMLPMAYSWLIDRLNRTGKAVSFGRVYVTPFNNGLKRIIERRRSYEYGETYRDFLAHNHAPIHSFLLDLEKLNIGDIVYFDDQKYMEDYLMTLQIFSEDNSDWESLKENHYVGDYIHSVDRAHTLAILDGSERSELLSDPLYLRCQARIDHVRREKRLRNQNRA